MKRLYVVLFLTVLALFSALASGFSLFYFLVFALIGVLAGSFIWAALNLMGVHISAQRRGGLARVGEFVETDLYIKNRSFLPKLLLEIRDLLELPGQATGAVVNLRPFQNLRWQAQAPLRKRGVYTLGPARAISSDLFGLFRLQRTFPGTDEVTVYPATFPLPRFQLSGHDGFHNGQRPQRTPDVTPSASTIREYSYGDSFRRIHWPSTIRTRRLMVKEFEADLKNQAWIVLDLHRAVQAGGEIDNTEECGVTIAASVALKFMEMGWPVGFIAHGQEKMALAPQRSPGAHERLLSILAVAKAEGSEPLAQVLRQAHAQVDSFSNLIVITPSTDVAWIQGINAYLGRRSRVVVILIDAHSFGGQDGAGNARNLLMQRGVLTYVVQQGERLDTALDYWVSIPSHTAVPDPSKG